MSKEKPRSGIAKLALACLMSLGVGAGGFWYYNNNIANASVASAAPAADPAAPPAQVTPVSAPIFYELEPFTVTLTKEASSRILYVGLTVQLQDEASRARLERYLPIARSRVITELGEVDPSALSERETKNAIRTAVSQSLALPFSPEPQRQYITDVLFTAFVVQ